MPQGLYRGMDRGEIDRQLNLRARWPEHTDFFARWAADSAAALARLGGHVNLAYGTSAGETLDLFLPPRPSAAGAPLLAFIHGGYWQSLDKGDFSYLAPPFVETGIAFASLNYDLAPKVGIAEIVAQIRGAILWLARHARDHGIDAGRIFVAGHSAGGHLAVMALATEWPAPIGRLVQGACSISGVYELEPIRQSYHQDILRLDATTVQAMSPLRRVPKRAGPLILAVGADETAEFLHQQEELAVAWRAGGLAVQVVDLPGRHHFSAVDALAERGHPLFAAVRALVLARG